MWTRVEAVEGQEARGGVGRVVAEVGGGELG